MRVQKVSGKPVSESAHGVIHPLAQNSEFSLTSFFLEALWPREKSHRLFLVCIFLAAISFWTVYLLKYSHHPLSVAAIHRAIGGSGDLEYYPYIKSLSQFHCRETATYEALNTGVLSFPIAPLLPHALGLGLFGAFGFVVGDIIAAFYYYVALAIFLRTLGLSAALASCASLLMLTGGLRCLKAPLWIFHLTPDPWIILGGGLAVTTFVFLLKPLKLFQNRQKIVLWILLSVMLATFFVFVVLSESYLFWRIPRPLLTEPFFFLCASVTIALFVHGSTYAQKKKEGRLWLFLGISLALMLQSDIYLASTLAFVIGTLILLLGPASVHRSPHRLNLGTGIPLFIVSFLVCAIPFILQRILEHPDVPVRLGVYPIKQILFLPGKKPYLMALVVPTFGFFLASVTRKFMDGAPTIIFQKKVLILSLIVIGTCFALPISTAILKKGIQIYHFESRLIRLFSFIIYVYLFCSFSAAALLLKAHCPMEIGVKRRLGFALVFGTMALSLISVFRSAYVHANKFTHQFHLQKFVKLPHYREDFVNLVRHLQPLAHEGHRVLGTFDLQTHIWWTTFTNGNSFLASAVSSTLPDGELERRLATLSKTVGIEDKDYLDFIKTVYINAFWLGATKYVVTQGYSIAPPDDYDEGARGIINKMGGRWDDWMLSLPISEQKRLLKNFQELHVDEVNYRLDLIVLTNDSLLKRFAPSNRDYELIYQNASFRLWKRIETI